MFKSIVLMCLVFLGSVGYSVAQDKANTAKISSKVALTDGKSNGMYSIVLPEGLTAEKVNKNASYYQSSFTVEYAEKSREAKIKMVQNDDKNRHVIVRFLGSCGVQYVSLDGKTISTEELFTTYMK